MKADALSGYKYETASHNRSHEYLLPGALRQLNKIRSTNQSKQRFFEVGCGNGSVASVLSAFGWTVTGIDPSEQGFELAQSTYPDLDLRLGSVYDELSEEYGRFPVVLSLEVVEHVYDPRRYAACIFSLLESGGTAIICTPYHGYWKNLAMALSGKMDAHFTALWDHGHIKFWSIETPTTLLGETGFVDIQVERVGRVPPLAKSMIAIARKP